MKLDYVITPYTKRNSKQFKNLNVWLKTITLLEENIGNKISNITHSNNFSAIAPQERKFKEKMNKQDYIKLKYFGMAKETINKIKRQRTKREYILADTSDKGLISYKGLILKVLIKFNTKNKTKKPNNHPIKKMDKGPE